MTTLAAPRPTVGGRTLRLALPRVVRSELLKLTSSRSTWITAVVVAAGLAGFAALGSDTAGGPAAAGAALSGSTFLAIVLGAFGAVVGAREFGSGVARLSLAAVPRRGALVTAKVLALLTVVVPTAVVGVAGALVVSQATGGTTLDLADASTLTVLAAHVGYLAAVAVLGLAIGLLLRSSAGGVATTLGALLVLPMVASLALPAGWTDLSGYLPSAAGGAMTSVGQHTAGLSPVTGGLVLLAWVVVALTAAVISLQKRDA